jgi:hypothetical protein
MKTNKNKNHDTPADLPNHATEQAAPSDLPNRSTEVFIPRRSIFQLNNFMQKRLPTML